MVFSRQSEKFNTNDWRDERASLQRKIIFKIDETKTETKGNKGCPSKDSLELISTSQMYSIHVGVYATSVSWPTLAILHPYELLSEKEGPQVPFLSCLQEYTLKDRNVKWDFLVEEY